MNEIPRDLFPDELVVGKVPIESLNHPVTVAPGIGDRMIRVLTRGIGVANQVKPVSAPPFTIMG